MSTLQTLSTFYYGFNIESVNQYLDFNEGGPEITASLPISDYSMSEFISAVEDAFNLASTMDYVVSVDRDTRLVTISAPSNFTLMCSTGSHSGSSAWELLGFDTSTNKTGTNTYTSENPCGYEYRPQTLLMGYVAPEDYEVKESAVVSISANGQVQTISFGDGQRMECNIIGATNLLNLKHTPFYENATGLQALRDFMKFLITKSKVEFMPDIANRAQYYTLLLDSSSADKNGTKFRIENMKGATYFYESGSLVFRKVVI